MIVRWSERVLLNGPPRWENYKVSNRSTRPMTRTSQHCKNAWVLYGTKYVKNQFRLLNYIQYPYTVIEADGVDRLEPGQVVFIWHVVAVPADHIERRMRHLSHEQCALVFRDNSVRRNIAIFEPSRWRLEVSRIGQTIGADRAQIRQSEVIVKHLENVSTEIRREDYLHLNLKDCIYLDRNTGYVPVRSVRVHRIVNKFTEMATQDW